MTESRRAYVGNLLDVIPEGWLTRRQAARAIGRSYDTIARWERKGIYVPSRCVLVGRLTISLYSAADVKQMKRIALGMRSPRQSRKAHDD